MGADKKGDGRYYPFGLTMAGISDKALKHQYIVNKDRGNGGSELQNEEFSDGSGLDFYDAIFRMYDPQIGRFWQIDPIGEFSRSWSPYSFVLDNPISFSDPIGLTDSLAPVTVTPSNNAPPCCQIAPIVGGAQPITAPPPPSEVPPLTVVPPTPPTEVPVENPLPDIPPVVVPAVVLTGVLVAIPITGNTHWPNGDEMFYYNNPQFKPENLPREVRSKPIDNVYLVRYGDEPETKEQLASDAIRAMSSGFPHGVSTSIRPKRPPYGRAAKVLDVMKHFLVLKTGGRPDHFTIVLPNPVTQQVADEFNALFTTQEP